MKSMKKLVTLLLSLVMLCALAMPAMAEGDGNRSITINGAVAGHTYDAYQVFSGVYYKGDRQNDTPAENEYLSDVKWGNGVQSVELLAALQAKDEGGNYNAIFGDAFKDAKTAEDVAYVVASFGDQSAKLDEFARIVGKHLSGTVANTTGRVVADTEAKITGLSDGYYFVKDSDSTAIGAGEIATKFLVEVVGDANVTVKATAPEFKKEVVKDSNTTGKGTSANVGDKVTFKLTATVPDMSSFGTDYKFIMHDTLSEGLTFDGNDSIKVKINNKVPTESPYAIEENPTDGSTFALSFDGEALERNAGVAGKENRYPITIEVEYTATLNKEALKTNNETNTAYLEYSNDPSNSTSTGKTEETPTEIVHVYNFNIDVDKYDGTDGTTTGKKLEKAVFVLYRKNGETKEYYKWDDANNKVTWVSEDNNPTQKTTDANGKATFEGLKEGTYYLKEITAPDGYNKLKEPVEVKIEATYNANGTLNTEVKDFKLQKDNDNGDHYYQVESIANKAGAVLPSTGGIGTTIFYVLGSILALGAAVLLIAKKRMNGQDR